MNLNDPKIPILGTNARTWRSVGMLPWKRIDPLSVMPGGQIVQEVFPAGVVMAGLTGERSDGEKVLVQAPIDLRLLERPEELGFFWIKVFQEFESYLQCACASGHPCVRHAAGAPAKPAVDAPTPALKLVH